MQELGHDADDMELRFRLNKNLPGLLDTDTSRKQNVVDGDADSEMAMTMALPGGRCWRGCGVRLMRLESGCELQGSEANRQTSFGTSD
jgi:hypothetical protein